MENVVSRFCGLSNFSAAHLHRDTRTNFWMHVAAACRLAFSSLSNRFMLSSSCLAQ